MRKIYIVLFVFMCISINTFANWQNLDDCIDMTYKDVDLEIREENEDLGYEHIAYYDSFYQAYIVAYFKSNNNNIIHSDDYDVSYSISVDDDKTYSFTNVYTYQNSVFSDEDSIEFQGKSYHSYEILYHANNGKDYYSSNITISENVKFNDDVKDFINKNCGGYLVEDSIPLLIRETARKVTLPNWTGLLVVLLMGSILLLGLLTIFPHKFVQLCKRFLNHCGHF